MCHVTPLYRLMQKDYYGIPAEIGTPMSDLQLHFDTRTLIAVTAAVALVPALIGALVWQTKRDYPGRWVLGNVLAAFAAALLGLRGHLPDWLSIVVANAFILGAIVAFLQGFRRFRGLPIRWWPECMVGVLTLAAIIWFRYVTDNINARILTMGLAMGAMGIACGITLLKQMPRDRRMGLIITGSVFTLTGVVNLVRGIYVFTVAPVADLFDPSMPNALFLLATSLGVVTWSFGFILLTAERLEVDTAVPSRDLSPVEESSVHAGQILKAVPPAEVLQQLHRVVNSDVFRRSIRMERFLTVAVERTLQRRPEGLKEYALGRDVFDRGEGYDPRTDSIVRVEAQRLRRKLREYYDSQGSQDKVIIRLPAGSYVPVFEYRQPEIPPRVQSQVAH